jgi:hypothetical protein
VVTFVTLVFCETAVSSVMLTPPGIKESGQGGAG